MRAYIFQNAHQKWWQKPLVRTAAGIMPAELAVMSLESNEDEEGLWINSRSTTAGVAAIKRTPDSFQTIRKNFPKRVSQFLVEVYDITSLTKGCPDLVIWKRTSEKFRFVEVKCPKWDRASQEQTEFITYAKQRGISATIAEWYFEEDAPDN